MLKNNKEREEYIRDENNWEEDEHAEDSWALDDPSMPDWLRQYL